MNTAVNTAALTGLIDGLSRDELRALSGLVMTRLRTMKAGKTPSEPAPSPAARKQAQQERRAPAEQAASRPWGIVSSANKTLKRRYASKAEADAAIPALVASTGLTYNATLIPA